MPRRQKPGSSRRKAIRRTREEKGDASTKVLHRTMVVCAICLLAVLAFAIPPKKPAAPGAIKVTTRGETKAPVPSFDRRSLSTKNR